MTLEKIDLTANVTEVREIYFAVKASIAKSIDVNKERALQTASVRVDILRALHPIADPEENIDIVLKTLFKEI